MRGLGRREVMLYIDEHSIQVHTGRCNTHNPVQQERTFRPALIVDRWIFPECCTIPQ